MRIRKKFFIFTFVLILMIAVLNLLAIKFHLYWNFWWFDIMMHFLGGLWVGLISLWLYFLSDYFAFNNTKKRILFVFILSLISVLVVGIGWEIFEYVIDINISNGYCVDTLSDLFMDVIGALVASFSFIKTGGLKK